MTTFNVNEQYSSNRFYVIIEITLTDGGTDSWTEEWFPRKAQAIAFAERTLARLADSCPENAPKVVVYDSQGPRDEQRRVTYINLAAHLIGGKE